MGCLGKSREYPRIIPPVTQDNGGIRYNFYSDSDVRCAVYLRETTGAGGAGVWIWWACIVVRKIGGYRQIIFFLGQNCRGCCGIIFYRRYCGMVRSCGQGRIYFIFMYIYICFLIDYHSWWIRCRSIRVSSCINELYTIKTHNFFLRKILTTVHMYANY